jgi:hypothetical protein
MQKGSFIYKLYNNPAKYLKYVLMGAIPVAIMVLVAMALIPFALPIAAFLAGFLPLALASAPLAIAILVIFSGYAAFNLARKIPDADFWFHFRYMVALIGLVGLFAALLNVFFKKLYRGRYRGSSPLSYCSLLASNINVFTASIISKRVVVNVLLFGLLVTLFLFSPIAAMFSLPFVLAASAIGALALSRVLCEHLVIVYNKKGSEDKTPLFLHMRYVFFGVKRICKDLFATTLPFFVPFLILGLFAPIGIALSTPFILAACGIAALVFGRVFFYPFFNKDIVSLVLPVMITSSIAIFACFLLALIPPLLLTTSVAFAVAAGVVISVLVAYKFLLNHEKHPTVSDVGECWGAAAESIDCCLLHIDNLVSHVKSVGYAVADVAVGPLLPIDVPFLLKFFGLGEQQKVSGEVESKRYNDPFNS